MKADADAEKARADAKNETDAKMVELQSKIDSLTADAEKAKTELAAEKTRADAAQAKIDAAELAARQVADAAELAKLTKLAEALKVSTASADGDKDLSTLRRDCASAIFGGDLPENYSDDAIVGILAPSIRKIDSGESLTDSRDSRYDGFRGGSSNTSDTPKARPSLRSRAADAHNNGRA